MRKDREPMTTGLGESVVTDSQGKGDGNVGKIGSAKVSSKNSQTTWKGKNKVIQPQRSPRKDPMRFSGDDDRRWCYDCLRLVDGIRCNAPESGMLIASMKYEPVQTMPRRCIAYLPCQDDPDQTPGSTRWPWLIETK